MNSFQTQVAKKTGCKWGSSSDPDCTNPVVYGMTISSEYVGRSCKEHKKAFQEVFPRVKFTKLNTGNKIRKSVLPHLGRLTKEERAAQPLDKMHVPRDLHKMLLELSDSLTHSTEEQIIEIFKHWLMDIAHLYRMSNKLDEQDVVEQIIKMIGDKK